MSWLEIIVRSMAEVRAPAWDQSPRGHMPSWNESSEEGS